MKSMIFYNFLLSITKQSPYVGWPAEYNSRYTKVTGSSLILGKYAGTFPHLSAGS